MKASIPKLVAAIAICQSAGLIGSAFTASSVSTWYAALQKPAFNPPSWLFAPVWITLYTLMGISAYLIWQKGLKKRKVKMALVLFGAQLLLNALWTIIFFGLKNPLLAFIEIIILLAAVAVTTIKFYPMSRTAAYLLIPYLLWTAFAAALNFAIVMVN
jgi:translocator protein